jgi:ATP-dependent protease HslVU (ClpYQ) peptidase subunit
MTTIIAYQGDNYAVAVADSKITSHDDNNSIYQANTLGSGSSKLATNGKYILGIAGDMRAINILHHAFTPPTVPDTTRGRKLDAFITSKYIPALRGCLETQGYSGTDKDTGTVVHASTILTIVNATIYAIESDYGWMSDSRGVYAIGTGASYALGAVDALMPKQKPTIQQAKTILLKAINIAAKWDVMTGPPFTVLTQER